MVRDTVAVADGNDVELEVCEVAQVSAAVAKSKARDRFFTVVLESGGFKRFLIFSMVRDVAQNEKNGKGWDFGNSCRKSAMAILVSLALSKARNDDLLQDHGMKAIVPFGPTTSAPPSAYAPTALKA